MTMKRRAFVSGSGFALAGVAAGAITGVVPASGQNLTGQDATGAQLNSRIASFGWEVTDLNDNGADVYFAVQHKMTLNVVNIDSAFMITSTPSSPGFAEILCRAAVTHGVPKFVKGDSGAPFVSPQSPDFGTVAIYNPDNLNVVNDGFALQNIFYNIILKTWVPENGTASSTSRHVISTPALKLVEGDYLVFHMNHAGVPGDAEMQVVLEYTLG
jgi:hypothetical protein